MAEFPALPIFTDAYLADTRHLTAAQHGAYLLLLMMAWRTPDCSLPDDDEILSRWAAMDSRTWQRNRAAVLQFWRKSEDGRFRQGRLSDERKKSALRRDQQQQAGIASALKRNERRSTDVPTSVSTKRQPPSLPFPKENNKHLPLTTAHEAKTVDNSPERKKGFNNFLEGGGRGEFADPSVAKKIGAVLPSATFDIKRHLTEKVLEDARKAAPGWDVYALATIYNEGIGKRGVPDRPGLAFVGWCKNYTKGNPP